VNWKNCRGSCATERQIFCLDDRGFEEYPSVFE
jgi:hypothetical protein